MTALEKTIETYKSIQLAKRHLVQLRSRLTLEKSRLRDLGQILDKEYQDVLMLEQISVHRLFYQFLGKKKDRYEIEKQEHLLAALKYHEAKKMVELLEFEQEVLVEKIGKEERVRDQLAELIKRRDLNTTEAYPQLKADLLALEYQLDHHHGFKRELHEALIVGLKLRDLFGEMIQLAKMADVERNWGNSSIPISIRKEQQPHFLDQVQQLTYKAMQLLQQFEDELEDIYKYKAVKRIIKFEAFQFFTDLYYDRLISGWLVQHKLVGAIQYFINTRASIQRDIETLKIQMKKTEHQIKYLHKRKIEVIKEKLG